MREPRWVWLVCGVVACGGSGAGAGATGAGTSSTGTTSTSSGTSGSPAGCGTSGELLGGLEISVPLRLSASTVAIGQTVTGTATLCNPGAAAITLNALDIAARPPGGTVLGGPYADLLDQTGPISLAPGQSYVLSGGRALTAADPLGGWFAYVTFQESTSTTYFNSANEVDFTVVAAGSVSASATASSGSSGASAASGATSTSSTSGSSSGAATSSGSASGSSSGNASGSSSGSSYGVSCSATSLPNATVGAAYAQSLTAIMGSGVYSQVSAAPNNGLWLYVTPEGTVSGTPQMAETETVVYQVTESGNTTQKTFCLTATASGTLSIVSPASLPAAVNGGFFAHQLLAKGGVPPYIWSSSITPQPCYVDWDGWLLCAPTSANTLTIPVTVTDSYGNTATQTETLPVGSTLILAGVDPTDGLIHLPPAIAGNAYKAELNAYGGSGSGYTYAATAGLPAWATLSESGVLTGTPTASGNVSLTLKVTDSANANAAAAALINISSSGKVERPSYNSNPSNGFFVLNGKVYDPNGYPFQMRGIDRNHYDSASWANDSNGALSGASAVRFFQFDIGFTSGTYSASQFFPVADTQTIANGILPIVTAANVPDAGGTSGDTSAVDLATTVAWWVQNEPTWAPIMDRIAINIANEWGPSDSTTWRDSYISAVSSLRSAGYTCPLVIDSGGSGQDVSDLLNYTAAIQASDPLQNCIFSFHAYGGTLNMFSAISNIQSSGGSTLVTLNSNLPYHPFDPAYPANGNSYTGQSAYVLSGVQGLTGINGLRTTSHNNVGGSRGAWTVKLDGTFSGTYVSGTGSMVTEYDYGYLMSQFAALRAQNVAVAVLEFGPGNETGNPSATAIGPSPTNTSIQQIISAAEANALPWAYWAWDDNNESGAKTSFAGWFGATVGGPGDYARNTPADLTAAGLDVVLNPRFGLGALASPAAVFE